MSYRYSILGLVFLSVLSTQVVAQSVGVGTNSPSSNAALHVVSQNNNQGILIPSLTTDQRLSEDFVSNLFEDDYGLLVFDLTENKFFYWSVGGWKPLISGTPDQIVSVGVGIALNEQGQIVNIGDTDSTNDVTIQTEAAGDLTGLYPAPEIADGVVETENLADSAVVGAKVADNTIDVNKLRGLSDPTSGRNSLLITSNNNTPRWFQPSFEQVIVTDNTGQISTRDVNSFASTTLETGNIFVGDGGNAKPLDASNVGQILVGNGTSLVSVEVMGDVSINGSGIVEIASGVIGSNEIEDGTIATVDIADEAITADKIRDGTVSAIDLSSDAVGSGTIANETILNEDINPLAGIQVAKLEAMPTGTIIFGNGGVPTIGTVSGDISIDETGSITLNTLNTITATTGNFTTLTATDGSGIAALNADNLTDGTLANDRLPDLITPDTYGGNPDYIETITVDAKGRVTAVTFGPPASDIRLKEDIQLLNYSPQNLNQLQAYRYTWKEERFGSEPQLGLIAQEVEKVYPELVQTRSDGYKGVNYQGLIPVLVEATKAQQDSITTLVSKNQSLQRQVNELEKSLETQSQELQTLKLLVQELVDNMTEVTSPSVTQSESDNLGGTNR